MICCANWFSSTTLRRWNCPSRDLWRTHKWSICTIHPQHRVCTWLQPRTWLAAPPLCHCFWLETRLQRSLTCTARAKILVSSWAALTQHRWTAGVTAMSRSMRLTHGCGNFGVASHAWLVCQLRRLKNGCKLTDMKVMPVCVELRLVGGARRLEPSGKFELNLTRRCGH